MGQGGRPVVGEGPVDQGGGCGREKFEFFVRIMEVGAKRPETRHMALIGRPTSALICKSFRQLTCDYCITLAGR